MNKKIQQSGFSLIEILITVVVISFSSFGGAMLQIKAQQFTHSSYLNTQVILLAHDMSERMRTNPAGMEQLKYNLPAATYHAECFTNSGCSATEMAENDMYEWAGDHENSGIRLLSQGSGVVCIDSTPDDGETDNAACDGVGKIYAIKIWWLNMDKVITRTILTSAFTS